MVALALVSVSRLTLNHLHVTVDPATFRAMAGSGYLRGRFAQVREETMRSGADSWHGLYVMGLGTYIEVFSRPHAFPTSDVGVCFLTTSPGGAEDAYAALHPAFGARLERTLRYSGPKPGDPSWFYMTSYRGSPDFSAWVTEFTSEEYASAGVPVGSGFAEMMRGWSHGKTPPPRVAGDIVGLTLRLSPAAREDFERALPLLGWTPYGAGWRRGGQLIRVFDGPASRVLEVRFSVRQKVAVAHAERFGPDGALRVGTDGTALLTFGT